MGCAKGWACLLRKTGERLLCPQISVGADLYRADTGPASATLVDDPRVDDPRGRIWSNGPGHTHSSRLDRVSKFSAALSENERLLANISPQGLHQFSIAFQGFLCISKYFICPLQKLCSLLDNSSIDQVVGFKIKTSAKQSLSIKVAAGEFYCFRIPVIQ